MRLPSRRDMALRLPRSNACYGRLVGTRSAEVARPGNRVSPMRIGILGGTGPAGSALAARLASVGFETIIGSRSKYRAMEAVDLLLNRWSDRNLKIGAGDNEAAAEGDIVVIATPWDGATQTAKAVEKHLESKVVVCMANALTRIGKEFQP